MGIIKSGIALGIISVAFYAGHSYAVTQYENRPVKIVVRDKRPALEYFGRVVNLDSGPRLGTIEDRVHAIIQDYQEQPAEVTQLLKRYLRAK